MTEPDPHQAADLATVAARFGAALHAEGLPVGPDRSERFARAVTVMRPATISELYWCGLATLVSDPDQIEVFSRVFAAVFTGLVDPAEQRGDPNQAQPPTAPTATGGSGSATGQADAAADRPAGSRGGWWCSVTSRGPWNRTPERCCSCCTAPPAARAPRCSASRPG